MEDPIICYMVLHYRINDMKALLSEFGLDRSSITSKLSLQKQIFDLIINPPIGFKGELFLTKLTETFNDIKRACCIQDPHDIKSKMTLEKDSVTMAFLLQAKNNNTKLEVSYDSIENIINPTILIGQPINYQLSEFGKRKSILFFCLTDEQIANILKGLTTSAGKFRYGLHLKICLLEPKFAHENNNMPDGLVVRINSNRCYDVAKGAANNSSNNIFSINCFTNIKPNVNLYEMSITWIPDGKTYTAALYLTKQLYPQGTMIEELKNRSPKSIEETKNEIIKRLTVTDANSDVFVSGELYFSLKCPLSKTRIKLPVKSVECTHLQCFDACMFILLYERKQKWKCPICSLPCPFNKLQVDCYFLDILDNNNIPDDVDLIQLLSDGTWKVYKEPINDALNSIAIPVEHNNDFTKKIRIDGTFSLRNLISENENQIEVIDLTEPTDDEVNVNSQAQGQSQQVANCSEQKKKYVIDLTVDDKVNKVNVQWTVEQYKDEKH